jgi:hypothetical protein
MINIDIPSKGIFNNIDQFTFLKDPVKGKATIGVGSFGEVKLAKHIESGNLYAIKIVILIFFSSIILNILTNKL